MVCADSTNSRLSLNLLRPRGMMGTRLNLLSRLRPTAPWIETGRSGCCICEAVKVNVRVDSG